jgi:tetratricopeptide (TPR) repeat protein
VQDRAARERSANLALGKADQLAGQARQARPETVADAEQAVVLWQQAEGQVAQAEGVLASAFGAEAARQRLAERRRDVEAGLRRAEAARDQARKEAKLLAELNKARERRANARGMTLDYESAAQAYAKAMAAYGLDVFGPEPGAVAAAIRRERPAVLLALIVALHDWGFCARDAARKGRLRQVAGLADDDGWRRRYRAAVAGGDLGALKRLAEEARGQALPAVSLELLATALMGRGAWAEAAALLRDGRGRHPADFWIHFMLGYNLYDPRQVRRPDPATLEEALGCFWAAVALRPDSAMAHGNLGNALSDKGRLDEAIAAYQKAVEIDPKLAGAHNNLGVALKAKGRLDEAIAAYQKAITIEPKYAQAHSNLGIALKAKGRLDEAIAAHRQAITIEPKYAKAHTNLGNALRDKGRLDEAIAAHRQAILIDPKYAAAHNNLGATLAAKGRLDEAIAEFRQAIEIEPKYAAAHNNLGVALRDKGRLDEAIAAFQKAITIDRKHAKAHYNLGNALRDKDRLDEAIAAFQKAIVIDRKHAKAHYNLGVALRLKGRWDEAIAAYQKAIVIEPKDAWAHYNLGNALRDKGRLDEAIAAYQKAIAIDPKFAQAHGALGQALLQRGRFAAARDATRRALDLLPERAPLRGLVTQQFQACERLLALDEKLSAIRKGAAQPAGTTERLRLAELCGHYKQRYVAAARFYADAFAADPRFAGDLQRQHRYHAARSAALAAAGKGEDAAKLPDAERAELRQKALAWLRADLKGYAALFDSRKELRSVIHQRLGHWLTDANLASVRDPVALAALPEAERASWRALWADVAALRKRTAETK